MKESVLLLDIDFTVINIDSMISFWIYSLKVKTLKTLKKIPYTMLILILYSLRLVTLKKAKEAVFYPIVDFKEDEIEEFFIKCIEPKINRSIKDIIEKSNLENRFILMVTASPTAYMKYFKNYGYADEVIGTTLECENYKYKNKILGKNCKGKEKSRRIEELFSKKGIKIDYENSYAYSDSKSDLPMLYMVKNRYLVNKKNGEIKCKLETNIAETLS